MPTIVVSNELSRDISAKSQKLKTFTQKDIDSFIKEDNSFQTIVSNTKKVLEQNQYVIIKNIGFVREKEIFESFVKQFGRFYGLIDYTDIKLECKYTGCSFQRIEWHNDDAIDILDQPIYGFIQVLKEDTLKSVKNGIVLIDDIVNYLEMYDREFLDDLLNIKINMLSYGINYDGKEKTKIVLDEPIFYRYDDKYNVRFDPDRVEYFYWKNKIKQSIGERRHIDKFLSLLNRFKKEVYLESGDILIHNNKRTLHDRGECSIELNLDGSLNTREIYVSFVRE